jgi:hypothetical protein
MIQRFEATAVDANQEVQIPTFKDLHDPAISIERLEEIANELEQFTEANLPPADTSVLYSKYIVPPLNLGYFFLGSKTIVGNMWKKAISFYNTFIGYTGYKIEELIGYNPFTQSKKIKIDTNAELDDDFLGDYNRKNGKIFSISDHTKPGIEDQIRNSINGDTPTIGTLAHEAVHYLNCYDLEKIKHAIVFMPAVLTGNLVFIDWLNSFNSEYQQVHPVAGIASVLGVAALSLFLEHINKRQAKVPPPFQLYDELIAQVADGFYFNGAECNEVFYRYMEGYKHLFPTNASKTFMKKAYPKIFILASLGFPIKELSREFPILSVRSLSNKHEEESFDQINESLNDKLIKILTKLKIYDKSNIEEFKKELELLGREGSEDKTPLFSALLEKANLRCRINASYLKISTYKEFGELTQKALRDKSKGYLFSPTRGLKRNTERIDSVYLLSGQEENSLCDKVPQGKRLAIRTSIIENPKTRVAGNRSKRSKFGLCMVDINSGKEERIEFKINPEFAQEVFDRHLQKLPRKERHLIKREIQSQVKAIINSPEKHGRSRAFGSRYPYENYFLDIATRKAADEGASLRNRFILRR